VIGLCIIIPEKTMSILYSEARVPTALGVFRLRVYDDPREAGPIAIIGGERTSAEPPFVRLHTSCFVAENLGSLDCDCRERLDVALERISGRGGIVVYLRRDSCGRGLADQIRNEEYRFVNHGCLDRASFETAATVLRDLGAVSIRLLTDDPGEAEALGEQGIEVVGVLPLESLLLSDAASVMSASLEPSSEDLAGVHGLDTVSGQTA
jgi:GTP cyclohydrolase II